MISLLMWLEHHWIVPVFLIFVAIVVTTYWPGRRSALERHGRIPLEDDR
ncbi:MAG: cbb3-type cytochrome c oxidase subunit 3 [Acetobacteraceae bacterium]